MSRTGRWFWRLACVSIFAIPGCKSAGVFNKGPSLGAEGIRAIWVTRWDYKNPSDIARVMDNSKSAGFNTILFQVRGAGTVCYRSRMEPWADELGGADPGFDPLAVACAEGKKRGLAVHAWVNVIPGWNGAKPPTNSRQLYHARPDWFWRDAQGRRQPLGWYASVNPCYPEVRRYLTAVMREIVAKYPVDGLHLDYIRYPNEWSKAYEGWASVPDYPRDARTLALFRRATGKTPEQDPAVWVRWRADQLTLLLREVSGMVRSTRPTAVLSAAVGPLPDEHYRNHFQDTRRWISEGLVHAVFPMNYAKDERTFNQRLAAWSFAQGKAAVVPGIMFDKRDGSTISLQLARARGMSRHFAAFAYNSLFERRDASGKLLMDEQSASRASLRQHVIPELRRIAGLRT